MKQKFDKLYIYAEDGDAGGEVKQTPQNFINQEKKQKKFPMFKHLKQFIDKSLNSGMHEKLNKFVLEYILYMILFSSKLAFILLSIYFSKMSHLVPLCS